MGGGGCTDNVLKQKLKVRFDYMEQVLTFISIDSDYINQSVQMKATINIHRTKSHHCSKRIKPDKFIIMKCALVSVFVLAVLTKSVHAAVSYDPSKFM